MPEPAAEDSEPAAASVGAPAEQEAEAEADAAAESVGLARNEPIEAGFISDLSGCSFGRDHNPSAKATLAKPDSSSAGQFTKYFKRRMIWVRFK